MRAFLRLGKIHLLCAIVVLATPMARRHAVAAPIDDDSPTDSDQLEPPISPADLSAPPSSESVRDAIIASGPFANERATSQPKEVKFTNSSFQPYTIDAAAPAVRAFQEGKVDECMALVRKAVADDPGLPAPKLILAELCLRNGQRSVGRRLLESAAVRDTKSVELFVLFGHLALMEGRLTDSWVHFDKAESLASRTDEADEQRHRQQILQGRATIAEYRQNWARAEETLAELVKLAPRNAKLRERWAEALFMSGGESDAFDQFDIAYRQEEGGTVVPEVSMGILHTKRRQFDDAGRWFDKAIKSHPADANAHFQWALALVIQDRSAEADEHAAKAAELGLRSVELDVIRGALARNQHKWEDAERFFKQALEASPRHDRAFYGLILTLTSQDKAKQELAFQMAQNFPVGSAESPWTLAAIGWAHHRAGLHEKAEQLLVKSVAAQNSHPDLLYLLGRCVGDLEKSDEARAVARRLQVSIDRRSLYTPPPEVRQWLSDTLQ